MLFGGDFNVLSYISNIADIVASVDVLLIDGKCLFALSYKVIHESHDLH